jgi:hypothetical protein
MKPIRILWAPVGLPLAVNNIDRDDHRALAALLNDGYMEMVPLPDDVVLICDEEGGRKHLPPNVRILGHVILGPAYFCRLKDGEMESLTDDDIKNLIEAIDQQKHIKLN